MTPLENRPEVLRRVADRLLARYEQGARLSADELDALAEACFRLGVHTLPELMRIAIDQLPSAELGTFTKRHT